MMTYTLNIGLSGSKVRHNYLAERDRLWKALRWLAEHYPGQAKLAPHGPEPTLVFIAQVGDAQANKFFDGIRDLATVLEQDAIAVYDGTHGVLVGPGASLWEPFDLRFFYTWEEC